MIRSLVGVYFCIRDSFFFQAEDGIRDAQESRGLGDVYKRQMYSWQGTIEEDEEYALSIKTKTELVDKVTARVKELHSYETPCIISHIITSGWPPYLDWIREETQ